MSINPVVFRRALFIILAISLLFLASRAEAEGCPKEPVEEEGGKHWCYSAGKQGNVHLWKPDGYDADTAVTVVYVHGHNIGYDRCTDDGYLDCIWDVHGLPAQFAQSGLKALFVAVDGPLNDRQAVKWTSLDALMDSIRDDGGIRPPAKVVVLAHSAGIFTAMRFLDDDRLVHVAALDALYLDSPKRLAAWYRASGAHRLTLVGAEGVHWRTSALGKKLKCDAAAPGGKLPRDRCVVAVDAHLNHMEVVTGAQDVIPHVLARMTGPPPAAKAAKKPPKLQKKRIKKSRRR
jgi:hypothetical protein